jgi:xanthosine utilization system XapX-like protein
MSKHYLTLTILAYISLGAGAVGGIMYFFYRIRYSMPPNPGEIGSAAIFIMIGLCVQVIAKWLKNLEEQIKNITNH